MERSGRVFRAPSRLGSVAMSARFVIGVRVFCDQISLTLTCPNTLFFCRSRHASPPETYAKTPFGDLRRICIIGTELVHTTWNCHLDVCCPLGGSIGPTPILSSRIRGSARPAPCYGQLKRCLRPRLEGVSVAAPWHPMDRALTIVIGLSDTVEMVFSTNVTL